MQTLMAIAMYKLCGECMAGATTDLSRPLPNLHAFVDKDPDLRLALQFDPFARSRSAPSAPAKHMQCPLCVADSTGRCNTLIAA